MKENVIENKRKRLKLYYGMLLTVLVVIGVSFAYFRLTKTQTNSNVIGTRSCLDTTLTEETSEITLSDAFPISDEDGMKQSPFTFTLTNNCDSDVKVTIALVSEYRTSTDTSYLKDDYVKTNLSTKGLTDGKSKILNTFSLTEVDTNTEGYVLQTTGLNNKESKSFDLRLWLDSETTNEQGLNKTWKSKIVVSVVASSKLTLSETILANNDVKTPVTTPGAAISTESEALLASSEDDYGTSYYFRGAVTNNYVEFANKCWRVVRINGDSSVKLVLHNDNASNAVSPCAAANNNDTAAFAHYNGDTYTSAFNSDLDDNAYVGFMYGTVGSSDYASTHANTNKSTILTNLETWYKNNLASYTDKLADTIWCNDKSTVTDGLGYGSEYTDYAAYNRLDSTKQPTLKCPNDNNGGKLSKFTVDDTTNGNGNLTYKIGLLTADEIAFAGYIYGNENSNFSTYLQENTGTTWWWSLSPYNFGGVGVCILEVFSGKLLGNYTAVNYGLRPAISLVSDITISGGSGTSEDPYVVN